MQGIERALQEGRLRRKEVGNCGSHERERKRTEITEVRTGEIDALLRGAPWGSPDAFVQLASALGGRV